MFDLVFLGTSASSPSADRGLSAHMLSYRQYRFLIDCGEGTQRQILRAGLGFKRLDKVLLTHGHLDHILGLGGLVSTLSRWEALDKLAIYGGKATLQRVRDLIWRVVLRGTQPPVAIELMPVQPGDCLMRDDRFTLTAFAVTHRGPDCLGYLFEEQSRRPFLVEAAEALAVPAGPERARLVRGEAVTLADGRLITPDMVLGEEQPGVRYVHIGDVGVTDGLEPVCAGADALTIEATYTEEEAEMAAQFGHLTARQAAELAVRTGVQHLILTHISRRHNGREILREARAVFPNTSVANDFDLFRIGRGRVLHTNLRSTNDPVPI
jgi:ribonuclease Z